MFIVLTFSFLINTALFGQEEQDTLKQENLYPDTSLLASPELLIEDSLRNDTLRDKRTQTIDAEVVYNALDSVVFSMNEKKVFLFNDAKVTYLDMELTADYIEFDMTNNEVFARGMPDSTGKIVGRPIFRDDGQELQAQQLRYNFKSQKGYIEAVITEQEGGYLHAEKTKKDQKGHIHLKDGKYTTCEAEHPHFYVALTKAKSIPGDKIVSGPAYLVLEDVPLPIGIPFGFFPNTKTNTSGILIPQYGEEARRGFYLRNGGYYLAINDYFDFTVTGDIYTNGTWGIRAGTNYRKRYRYNGGFNFRLYRNISGEKGLDNYSKGRDYSIMWSHNQDAKANPTQTFRASVNLSSQRFDRNHSRILTNALTNTKQSSISYQKRWNDVSLSVSANHSQNSNTGSVDLNLPRISLSTSTFYPFRSKTEKGRDGFWNDIQLRYSAGLDNRIKTNDSLIFTRKVWENMNNGFEHRIPVTWNFKPKRLTSFTVSPNLTYRGVAYTRSIRKFLAPNVAGTQDSIYVEEQNGLFYAHAYYPSMGASLSPKLYGFFNFRENSRVQVIRHVMSPNVSFSYIPDVSSIVPDYYRELKNEEGEVIDRYSIFQNGIYGTPTLGRSSATMSFSL
ncbi:MAG: putative LPS assembly protein LptD, partial [Bacteroidota bacterium]